MASQITCITKPGPYDDHEHITHVGGASFYITREACANNIDTGRETYFVQVGNDRADVTTYTRNGLKFIRTKRDRTNRDNLLSLRQC
jgi:hypothetical protein